MRDKYGDKRINLYYTGHGGENTGNWVFKDGVISLQDVLDCFVDEEGTRRYDLIIYADCCYAGDWCKQLEYKKVKGKCKDIRVIIWAAASYVEIGTECVFSDLLKGQLPDNYGFQKLYNLEGKVIGKNQTLTYYYNEWKNGKWIF